MHTPVAVRLDVIVERADGGGAVAAPAANTGRFMTSLCHRRCVLV